MQRIFHPGLLFLHLDLGGRADLDDRHTAGELRHPLLQLFAIVVGGGFLDLLVDLLDPALDLGCATGPVDDGGVFLADLDLLGFAEVLQARLLQRQADLLGDHLAAGEDGDILQHGLAPVAEAGRLHGRDLDDAADVVDHQRRQGLAFHVLGNDEQRTAGLGHALEQRQQVTDIGNLLVVNEDEGVFQFRRLALLIVDEVGRQVAAIELHALDHVQLVGQSRTLFHRDHAFLAHLVHGLGNDGADFNVGVGGNGPHLGDGLVVLAGLGLLLEFADQRQGGLVHTALQVHGIEARGHGLQPFAQHRLRQHGRRGGAVTGCVGGLRGHFLDHLHTHVLELVFQLDLLRNRHPVLGHGRCAEALFHHHVAALGPQGDLDGAGQHVDALEHPLACVVGKSHFFCHFMSPMKFSKIPCGAASAFNHCHDVVFTHHQQFLAVHLDLGTGVLAEQHLVADRKVEGPYVAVLKQLAVTHGKDFTLDGLFRRGIRNHDPSGRGPLFLSAPDDDAIM